MLQVALQWIVRQGVPLVTKADDVTYLAEVSFVAVVREHVESRMLEHICCVKKQDLDLFSWNLTSADMDTLTSKV